ncbi:MAG: tellurite resistance TerB family protein, partial [Desulfovibrio sp.]|nr:tellurite resistance TerB family protein [Desulfovibrio sp.]
MSIFDVLNTDSFGSVLETLTGQARSAARNLESATPGGLGGLLGAGALGAVLGNFASGDLLKNVALAGAGAVAWNFYRKWAAGQQGAPAEERAEQAAIPANDPTAELVMRAMVYAARADGTIDATERQRINKVLQSMLGAQDASAILDRLQSETLDPMKIAAQTRTPEQGEAVYSLSCSVSDIDHFMERGYLDALAQSLGISNSRK